MLKEPFPEEMELDVSRLPVRVEADESARCPENVRRRIDMGYRVVTLKPIAKTMVKRFVRPQQGVYFVDDSFYQTAGGSDGLEQLV